MMTELANHGEAGLGLGGDGNSKGKQEDVTAAVRAASWYAVRTRANHEFVATSHLTAKKIDAYLPTVEVPSRRTDRRKLIDRPLFSGYFFVRTDLERRVRIAVLDAPGVVSILGSSSGPIAVPAWQVDSIRIALATRHPLEVLNHLARGSRVRVVAGPLAGMEGVVESPGGAPRIVVSVELLGRSIAVKLSGYDVEPL